MPCWRARASVLRHAGRQSRNWKRDDTDAMAKRVAAVYIVVVLGLTLLPIFGVDPDDPIQVQLEPFQTIIAALKAGLISRDFVLLAGNLVMLIPLGVLIPVLTGRRGWLRVFAGALALSGGIELAQLAISLLLGFGYRTASVDDVITNVAGALAGYALFLAYSSLSGRRSTPADP